MNETWDWLVTVAGWTFLLGTLMVAASALPAVTRRTPRLLLHGFFVTLASFLLAFLSWGLPRLLS